MCLAGRGWGKTRVGAEDSADYGMKNPKSRIAIVVPTFNDGRDTCIEGESGLLASIPEKHVLTWNRSIGELFLVNGTQYHIYTSEKPERLRGPQHHRAWCDEVGAWRNSEYTWDMLQMGLRLGDHPQAVITTTPKPLKVIRDLVKDSGTVLSTGSTYDNRGHLPVSFLKKLLSKYEGTRLGQQELYAKLLEDVPGALWMRDQIDNDRVRDASPEVIAERCRRIVVAIDPSVSSEEASCETGIVVAGVDAGMHGYVLADYTIHETPLGWAKEAIKAFERFGADCIIGEANNGGDLVEANLRQVNANIPYSKVIASRGKMKRAEPVSALYEQHRISHVGLFESLEDQMCMFTPDNIADNSPDRADALVWAFTELYDGFDCLGLLDLAKAKRDKGLVHPGTIVEAHICPVCSSSAVMVAGTGNRCNQCGHQYGAKAVEMYKQTRVSTRGGVRAVIQ